MILDNLKLREVIYCLYFIIDSIESNSDSDELLRINSEIIYDNFVYIYKKIGYDKNTLKFLDSNNDIIINIFNNYLDSSIKWAEFLILFDEKNLQKYEVYLK